MSLSGLSVCKTEFSGHLRSQTCPLKQAILGTSSEIIEIIKLIPSQSSDKLFRRLGSLTGVDCPKTKFNYVAATFRLRFFNEIAS